MSEGLFILASNVLIWARFLQSPETFRVHSRAQRVIVTSHPGKRAERVCRARGGLRASTHSKNLSAGTALTFGWPRPSGQIGFFPFQKHNLKRRARLNAELTLELQNCRVGHVGGNDLVRRAQSVTHSRERLPLGGDRLQLRGKLQCLDAILRE